MAGPPIDRMMGNLRAEGMSVAAAPGPDNQFRDDVARDVLMAALRQGVALGTAADTSRAQELARAAYLYADAMVAARSLKPHR